MVGCAKLNPTIASFEAFFQESCKAIMRCDTSQLTKGKNFGDRLCSDDEVLEMMEVGCV